MPKRYRKRKRNRRRRKYKGRRKKHRMTVNVVRSPLMADTTYVKLKYFGNATLNGSTNPGLIFRGNSVFDPDNSGFTATQPTGFDQYAEFYNHYQVLGSALEYKCVNLSDEPARLFLIPTYSTGVVGAIRVTTNPYGKHVTIGGVNGNGQKTISNYMRTKKMFGRSTDSVNYAATVLSNPSSEWYWHMNAQSYTLNDCDLDGDLIITYYVKFWERNFLLDA